MNLLMFFHIFLLFIIFVFHVTEIVNRDVKPQVKITVTGLCWNKLVLQLHINIHTRHTVHVCVFKFNGV